MKDSVCLLEVVSSLSLGEIKERGKILVGSESMGVVRVRVCVFGGIPVTS